MPVFNSFERQDDMAYEFALTAVTSLCDDVMQSGMLTRDRYNQFFNELAATGNTYKVDMEAHKKVYNRLNANEVVLNYYRDYTRQIEKEIETNFIQNPKSSVKSAAYLFEAGDSFYIKVRNSNVTQATVFFQALGGQRDYVKIKVDYGGIIKSNEWKDADLIGSSVNYIPPAPVLTSNPNVITSSVLNNPSTVVFTAISNVLGNAPPIAKYHWTVTDGSGNVIVNTSTTGNTFSRYFNNGNYIVRVKAEDVEGNISRETRVGFVVANSSGESVVESVGSTSMTSIPLTGATVVECSFKVVISGNHNKFN